MSDIIELISTLQPNVIKELVDLQNQDIILQSLRQGLPRNSLSTLQYHKRKDTLSPKLLIDNTRQAVTDDKTLIFTQTFYPDFANRSLDELVPASSTNELDDEEEQIHDGLLTEAIHGGASRTCRYLVQSGCTPKFTHWQDAIEQQHLDFIDFYMHKLPDSSRVLEPDTRYNSEDSITAFEWAVCLATDAITTALLPQKECFKAVLRLAYYTGDLDKISRSTRDDLLQSFTNMSYTYVKREKYTIMRIRYAGAAVPGDADQRWQELTGRGCKINLCSQLCLLAEMMTGHRWITEIKQESRNDGYYR
ncbi:hypothetical protein TruAng_001053 [Truncatella angustata]|nr:hypothetical protein TruAng_001053 [Truncatella angustata]